MSAYYTIIEAVKTALESISGMPTVKIREQIAYLPNADTLPLVIVAPRADSWEKVAAQQFGDNAHFLYPVLIGWINDNPFDQTTLQQKLDFREDVRQKLFKGTPLASVSTVFDCEYEPNPRGVSLAAVAPPLTVSLQEFRFKNNEARNT